MYYAKFDIEGVKKIYEHSVANPLFTPSFSQLYDGRYRKDGQDIDVMSSKLATAEDVDIEKIPPHASIVKDDGIYLMAATETRLVGGETKNFVVYAEGMDPNKDEDVWDAARNAVGGSDFSESIPLEWLKMAIEDAEHSGTNQMIVQFTEDGMALMTVGNSGAEQ